MKKICEKCPLVRALKNEVKQTKQAMKKQQDSILQQQGVILQLMKQHPVKKRQNVILKSHQIQIDFNMN